MSITQLTSLVDAPSTSSEVTYLTERVQAMIGTSFDPKGTELLFGDYYTVFNYLRLSASFEHILGLGKVLDEEQRIFFGRLIWAWMGERQKTRASDVHFTADMKIFKDTVASSGLGVAQNNNTSFLKHSGAYGHDYLGLAA